VRHTTRSKIWDDDLLTAYAWKLNTDLIYGPGSGSPVDVMETHEFPRTFFTFELQKQIAESYPYGLCRRGAVETEESANAAISKQEWLEAYFLFQRCAGFMERFRDPAIIATVRTWYLWSAECAVSDGSTALSLLALSMHFSIGEITPEAIKLKRIAKDLDANAMQQIEDLLQAPSLSYDEVEFAVRYAISYPILARLALAERIVGRLRSHSNDQDEPRLLLCLARCYMSQGRWQDVSALLTPAASQDSSVREQFFLWQGLMEPVSGRKGLFFGPIPEDCQLDVTDAVNRGFTYFVNAFYEDALEWFLFAQTRGPADPFALFGHGLCLWRTAWFSLAAEKFQLARIGLEKYPREFRFVCFSRFDETCPPRSYQSDDLYLIFNPSECLDRVNRRQPFVSHVVVP
jgi:tetratricopeptide (TPR) repeat protein